MKFTKNVFKNGLRVITVPMKDNPTATVLVLVETGSKYETKENNGISHFLEHMCFKGTEKRPTSMDIVKELDAIGSQSNAFTSHEYTGYYAKANAKHFKKIFDVISDIYLNSTFPEKEIEKEKGVIIEEMNMYEDMPHRDVQDLIMTLLYGGQSAGMKIIGTKENILKTKREDFIKYKKEHYVPEATTVIVSGNINEKEVLKEIEKTFGKIPASKKYSKQKVKEIQKNPEVLLKYKKTDQTHFVLAYRSFGFFDKRSSAVAVLGAILGGGMSSRLFQKLREEMGVGYYVRAYNDGYTDHGFFQISAGVDNKRIDEVLKVVLAECKKIKEYLVEDEELERVKEFLIGNMKLSLESSDDIANFYGAQESLKKEIKTAEEKAKEIRAISKQDIKKLAGQIFKEEKLNLALIGPFKDKNKFKKILKF